jgi:hypothetical protein
MFDGDDPVPVCGPMGEASHVMLRMKANTQWRNKFSAKSAAQREVLYRISPASAGLFPCLPARIRPAGLVDPARSCAPRGKSGPASSPLEFSQTSVLRRIKPQLGYRHNGCLLAANGSDMRFIAGVACPLLRPVNRREESAPPVRRRRQVMGEPARASVIASPNAADASPTTSIGEMTMPWRTESLRGEAISPTSHPPSPGSTRCPPRQSGRSGPASAGTRAPACASSHPSRCACSCRTS